MNIIWILIKTINLKTKIQLSILESISGGHFCLKKNWVTVSEPEFSESSDWNGQRENMYIATQQENLFPNRHILRNMLCSQVLCLFASCPPLPTGSSFRRTNCSRIIFGPELFWEVLRISCKSLFSGGREHDPYGTHSTKQSNTLWLLQFIHNPYPILARLRYFPN